MTAPAKAAPMREDVTHEMAQETVAKMIKDRKSQLKSCERMLELLQPEWDSFEARTAHDVYVARDYADHTSAARTHRKEIDALEAILARITPTDAPNLNSYIDGYEDALEVATARPDAGDDKAEIERLRGLLIDPGTPPWENARAVLVGELRKSGHSAAAYQVSNGQPCDIPSAIALNLIAQAARRPDAGDEDVERVAIPREPTESMMDAGLYQSSHDSDWADVNQTWKAMFDAATLDGGSSTHAPAAMREGVDRGMVERAKEAARPILKEIDRLERDYGFDRPMHQGQCLMLPLSDLIGFRAALSLEQPR